MKVEWKHEVPTKPGWYWWYNDELVTRLQYVSKMGDELVIAVGGIVVNVAGFHPISYWAKAELPDPPDSVL